MRIATKTLFDSGVYRINANLSDVNKASTVVSTGKKINSASDDPTGYAGVLGIHTSISQLAQVQRNITTGSSWLNNTESVLTTIEEDILTARDACIQLAGGNYSDKEREAVAEQINDILLNIGELSATRIDHSYLFSGTATDTRPFVFDDDTWPTSATYEGNDTPFSVDTGNKYIADVSLPGNQVFIENTIWVDDTNNAIDFLENAGTGQLTAEIPEGEYTAAELAAVIEDVMEQASQAANRVTGITNSAGIGTSVVVDDYSLLDMPSVGSFQMDWNGTNWELTGNGGYTSAVLVPESDGTQVAIDLDGDAMGDIEIFLDEFMTAGTVSFDVTAGTAVNYDVAYDETTGSFSVSDEGGTLTELDLLWDSGSESARSIAPDIGFSSDAIGTTTYTGDSDVTWGIFETLMDLRDAMQNDDTDGITRAITRLNAHYDHFSTQVSLAGITLNVMETRESVMDTLMLNLETRQSETEDADMVRAISDLTARQTAYEASLSAYSKIISVSILDYI